MDESAISEMEADETGITEPMHHRLWLGGLSSIVFGVMFYAQHDGLDPLYCVALIVAGVVSLWVSRFGTRWQRLSTRQKIVVVPGVLAGVFLWASVIWVFQLMVHGALGSSQET